MTSALRKYAQVDSRSRCFILLDDIEGWTLDSAGASSTSLMELRAFIAAFVTTTYPAESSSFAGLNATVLDTGRQITVYDGTKAGSPHVAIFREVFYYDSATSSSKSFYICTQILDYTQDLGFSLAKVARIG